MIRIVTTKRDLKRFVFFVKTLYKNDPYNVYPIFFSLRRELSEHVLEKQDYTALLCVRGNQVVGRILYTVDESKKKGKPIGYFSYFDCFNDASIARELFDHMETDLMTQGIDYVEGTFAPYDPDNRRGILVKGFDSSPVVFTSYNYDYYANLLETVGCKKAIDTVLLNAKADAATIKRLSTVSKYFTRSHDIRVDPINLNDLDKDIADVHRILSEATNDIVYQDAPSLELVESAARSLKAFINPNLIRIARENADDRPVGFVFVMPDYNQIFKATKGRLRILKILRMKKKITKARGMMQYVVPDHQNTGLIGHMFKVIYDEFQRIGITDFEAGTMMEDNPKPINAFIKLGGEIIKIYRLYGKEL